MLRIGGRQGAHVQEQEVERPIGELGGAGARSALASPMTRTRPRRCRDACPCVPQGRRTERASPSLRARRDSRRACRRRRPSCGRSDRFRNGTPGLRRAGGFHCIRCRYRRETSSWWPCAMRTGKTSLPAGFPIEAVVDHVARTQAIDQPGITVARRNAVGAERHHVGIAS